MDCPRCKLPLRPEMYEGVETDMCDNCWGFWLDSGELEQILESKDFEFSAEERDRILDLRGASKPDKRGPAPCPKCGETMRRAHYDESISLVVDHCPEHGVWLDTGEIKRVQALADKSDELRRLLLRKFGLAGQE